MFKSRIFILTFILISIKYDFAINLDTSLIYNTSIAVKDSKTVTFDTTIQPSKIIDEMGFGWNLGNSFDANNKKSGDEGLISETSWGNPKTTEKMITKLVQKGFKSIRIPVSWHNHIIDQKYTIDPKWMERVKKVVDICLKKGLYVIINVHHDQAEKDIAYGHGYYPLNQFKEESEKFLLNIWTQITVAFNNGYDHHLLFETLNEPRLRGDSVNEWVYNPGNADAEECIQVINEYNNLIHSVIRKSGGNNKVRFLLYTNGAAGFNFVTSDGFVLPEDTSYNTDNKRILVSVHMYSPYYFASNGDMTYNNFNMDYINELENSFHILKNKFVDNGHYVIITEMGASDKMNTDQRIAWGTFFVKRSRQLGMACVVWDNKRWNNDYDGDEKYGLYHRDKLTFEPDSLVDAFINAAKTPIG